MQDSDDASIKKRRKYKKGIYLLPNLFTTGALFSGFYAIVAAMHDRFEAAAIAIFVAMILDGLDGRVARLTNSQTEFGAEYDSLSDLVSFGLAPGLLMYQWALVHLRDLGTVWGKIGWLAAFLYVACAALRLARFNTQVGKIDKRWFIGLPSPAAAAIIAGMVWVFHDHAVSGQTMLLPAMFLIVMTALFMVSNIRYHSFKDFDLRERVPFMTMLLLIGGLMLVTLDPPKFLFGLFLAYGLSGPIRRIWYFRRRKVNDKSAKSESSSD